MSQTGPFPTGNQQSKQDIDKVDCTNQLYTIDNVLFIPSYNTMLIKGLSNISMTNGTVDCKFTLITRIFKSGVPDNIMDDIRENGILLRLNDAPYSIDKEYKNKVIKETKDLYIINIRDKIMLEFNVKLKQTPFDNFTIPFKVELTSKQNDNILYRFNCHLNQNNDNVDFKGDNPCNLPDFQIDYRDTRAKAEMEKKKNKQGEIVYNYYPAVIFELGLFRRPEPIIGTLFLPIFILTLMQVLVFFSSGEQNEKLANCATILLAILSYQ